MVYKFFEKKSERSGVNIEIMRNEELTKELYKQFIRNFKKGQFIPDFKTIFGVLI